MYNSECIMVVLKPSWRKTNIEHSETFDLALFLAFAISCTQNLFLGMKKSNITVEILISTSKDLGVNWATA